MSKNSTLRDKSIYKLNELLSYLDSSLSNRKKEIANFFLLIKQQPQHFEISSTINKSFILLLYTHWEGFIKESTMKYFQYICFQKEYLKDLTENFHLINFKDVLKNYKITSNIAIEKEILEKFYTDKKFNIELEKEHFQKYILGIENNLKFKNYKNICIIMNYSLNDKNGKLEKELSRLIDNRNAIAHTGLDSKNDELLIDISDISDIERVKNAIFDEMESFASFIELNLVEKKYLIAMHNE